MQVYAAGEGEEEDRMPDVAVHYSFGQQVIGALPPTIVSRIRLDPFTFALFGPDPWFVFRPWKEKRGRMMHTRKTGAFLSGLAERARQERGTEAGEQLFSYLAGFLCHYTLDACAHPYIIWQTTEVCRRKGAHRAFEHTMDVLEVTRAGFWQGAHPVTARYLPPLQLPPEMKQGLETVYGSVYGWNKAWSEVNRSYSLFRLAYRWMEKPGGAAALLARGPGGDLMRSLAYSESYFEGQDVENTQRAEWHYAYNPERTSRMSFSDLRREAGEAAVRMIMAVRAYVEGTSEDPAALREIIGNRSYLSGLDVDDPRNWNVRDLLPAILTS